MPLELIAQGGEVLRASDVELQDTGRIRKPRSGPLGDPPNPAEAGQQDLGSLSLRLFGDRVGDAVAINDAGDQDSLAVEEHERFARG
jgi:hypothetical protein